MLTTPVHLVSAITTGGDIKSARQQVTNMIYMSFQCFWTGTTHGVIKIQMSNKQYPTADGDWTDLGSGSVTIDGTQPAGTPGSLVINNNATGVPWEWVRFVFTCTDGTGLMDVYFDAKGA